MQAALALIADGPATRRRRNSPLPWVLLGSVAAHLLVLIGLASGVHVMPAMVEPQAITMELLRPPEPSRPVALPRPQAPSTATRPAPPARRSIVPVAAPVAGQPSVAPSLPTAAIAPPGFKAQGLTGGGDTLRQAARAGIGCRNVDALALTKAERAACAEVLGEKNKNRPAMYAVIDPAKKAAFDGDCRKDDDWCLYRSGKGPYPGLLALGKKRKIKGWD
jgi:hypothetical protein